MAAALAGDGALPFADDDELAALLTASVRAHAAAASSSPSTLKDANTFAHSADGAQADVIALHDEESAEDDDDDEGDGDVDGGVQDADVRIARQGSDTWLAAARATSTSQKAGPSSIADAAYERIASGATDDDTMSHRTRKRLAKEKRTTSAGEAWYGLPRLLPSTSSPTAAASSIADPTKDPSLTPSQRARALTSSGGPKNSRGGAADARSKAPAEIAREVQAIRLRNALDPKRFYRGARGDRALALPEFAQIGTIVDDANAPRQNLSRSERSRTRGSVVDELLRDEGARDYAGRKFEELQEARSGWSQRHGQGKKRKADGAMRKGKKARK